MKIVCLGDSLTFGYGLRRSQVWTGMVANTLGVQVINKGICGDTTGGMLTRYFRDVLQNRPSHVFLMGGTNDFIMESPMGVVKSNMSTMVHHSLTNNIKPIVGIQIPKEVVTANEKWFGLTDFKRVNDDLKRYREWVIEFCKVFNINYIDFHKIFSAMEKERRETLYLDGLHPTEEGHRIMARMFEQSFQEYL